MSSLICITRGEHLNCGWTSLEDRIFLELFIVSASILSFLLFALMNT